MRSKILLFFSVLFILPLLAHASSLGLGTPLRLSVNNWRVEPGDSYTLTWMERGGVNPTDDYILEEATDPQFKDKKNLTTYTVRAHRKKLENNAAFSHTVRYYRVRTRGWVRGMADTEQSQEEIVSNIVRVTLVGTNKADPIPSFPDDPELPVKKKKGEDGKKDSDKDYPTMGLPDLVINAIVLDPPSPRAGDPFVVHVSVKNQGVVPSPKTTVLVRVLGRDFEIDVEPLKPRYAVDVMTPPQKTPQEESIAVHCEVDPFGKVAESREDNNMMDKTFKVSLPAESK